jgi:hypothetical protein
MAAAAIFRGRQFIKPSAWTLSLEQTQLEGRTSVADTTVLNESCPRAVDRNGREATGERRPARDLTHARPAPLRLV